MLILASASPRRRELMEKLHRSFLCEVSSCKEELPEGLPATEAAEYLAVQKAQDVLSRHREDPEVPVVIGSDTVVICDGQILGKPKDAEDACRMLRALSGRTHLVCTGVCICSPKKTCSFTSTTEVRFYPLTHEEIQAYVQSGEPMDKAGAYGIQGDGSLLVEEIRGDYYSVMGLPIARVARSLRSF